MPTYYQRLRDAGYRVAGVGKFDLHKDTSDPANLDWHLDGSRLLKEWGFTEGIDNEGKIDGSTSYRTAGKPKGPYLNFLAHRGKADAYIAEHENIPFEKQAYTTVLSDEEYCDNWIAENGKQFIRDFPKDQPWHLVVNFTGPHQPMDVTERMRASVKDRTYPEAVAMDAHTPEVVQDLRRNYVAMIENIDRLCGELIAEVEARGELDNTVIVYSSDHGEMLGDFNRLGKNIWRFASAHVPLIIAGPRAAAGTVTEALADLTDIPATFLDYARAETLPDMHGQSLRDLVEGRRDTHRPVVRSGLGDWRMVYDGRYKLVTENGQHLLFDLLSDPNELVDIAAASADIVDRLAKS